MKDCVAHYHVHGVKCNAIAREYNLVLNMYSMALHE